jgi:hypothetical protein
MYKAYLTNMGQGTPNFEQAILENKSLVEIFIEYPPPPHQHINIGYMLRIESSTILMMT